MTTGIAEQLDNVEKVYIYGIPFTELPKYSVKPPIGSTPVQNPGHVNFELLDSVLEYIKAHPTTWRQESWYKIVDRDTGAMVNIVKEEETVEEVNSCGASFCFAGHVAIREGFPNPPKSNDDSWTRLALDSDGYSYHQDVSDFAETVLGLTWSQADTLFDGANTLQDLEEIVEGLHLNPKVHGSDLRDMVDRRNFEDEGNLTVREYMEKYDLLPVDGVTTF